MAPWANKTGLAKATAILATVLVVSLGLCGANYLTFTLRYETLGSMAFTALVWTAWCEVAAIVVSGVGLVVVGVMAFRRASRGNSRHEKGE